MITAIYLVMYPDRGYGTRTLLTIIIYSHKPFRVCSLSQTILVLMWTTTTTGLSLESLLTHEQDFFQGHAHGDGKLNMNVKQLCAGLDL